MAKTERIDNNLSSPSLLRDVVSSLESCVQRFRSLQDFVESPAACAECSPIVLRDVARRVRDLESLVNRDDFLLRCECVGRRVVLDALPQRVFKSQTDKAAHSEMFVKSEKNSAFFDMSDDWVSHALTGSSFARANLPPQTARIKDEVFPASKKPRPDRNYKNIVSPEIQRGHSSFEPQVSTSANNIPQRRFQSIHSRPPTHFPPFSFYSSSGPAASVSQASSAPPVPAGDSSIKPLPVIFFPNRNLAKPTSSFKKPNLLKAAKAQALRLVKMRGGAPKSGARRPVISDGRCGKLGGAGNSGDRIGGRGVPTRNGGVDSGREKSLAKRERD